MDKFCRGLAEKAQSHHPPGITPLFLQHLAAAVQKQPWSVCVILVSAVVAPESALVCSLKNNMHLWPAAVHLRSAELHFFLLLLQKLPAFMGVLANNHIHSPVLCVVERMPAVNGAYYQFISAGLENVRLGCNRWLWWILKFTPLVPADVDL